MPDCFILLLNFILLYIRLFPELVVTECHCVPGLFQIHAVEGPKQRGLKERCQSKKVLEGAMNYGEGVPKEDLPEEVIFELRPGG